MSRRSARVRDLVRRPRARSARRSRARGRPHTNVTAAGLRLTTLAACVAAAAVCDIRLGDASASAGGDSCASWRAPGRAPKRFRDRRSKCRPAIAGPSLPLTRGSSPPMSPGGSEGRLESPDARCRGVGASTVCAGSSTGCLIRRVATAVREAWMPLARVVEIRTLVRLRKDLTDDRREWQQRVQAKLFHQGVKNLCLTTTEGRRRRPLASRPADCHDRA